MFKKIIFPGSKDGSGGFLRHWNSRVADCRNEAVVEEQTDVPEHAVVLLKGGLDEAVYEHHWLGAVPTEVVEDEKLPLHLHHVVENVRILGDGKEILQGGRAKQSRFKFLILQGTETLP